MKPAHMRKGSLYAAAGCDQLGRNGHRDFFRRDGSNIETNRGVYPIEKMFLEIPKDAMGAVMENLSGRKAEITHIDHHGEQVGIEALIPMRGLIGFETDLVNMTRGLGVMSHLFHEYGADRGEIAAPERIVWVNSFSDEEGNLTRHPASPTWPLEMLTTVTFTEEKGKTTVTVRWIPLNATPEEQKTFDGTQEGMRQGWTGTFDQLTRYLANAK